jgi:hypothetical protein
MSYPCLGGGRLSWYVFYFWADIYILLFFYWAAGTPRKTFPNFQHIPAAPFMKIIYKHPRKAAASFIMLIFLKAAAVGFSFLLVQYARRFAFN